MSKNTWRKLLLVDSLAYLATILSIILLFIKAIDYRITIALAVLTVLLFVVLIKNEPSVPFHKELLFDGEDGNHSNETDKHTNDNEQNYQ